MSSPEATSGELAAIARLAARLGAAPGGEVFLGDDTAVLSGPQRLLFATDVLVEGVHFRREYGSLADAGWKALATNLSDIAAMAGTPTAAVVGLVGAAAREIDEIYDGIAAASAAFDCPIVGGDLTDGPTLVIAISVIGSPPLGTAVLRSGARAGDRLFLTGSTGAASAGLRALERDVGAVGSTVEAHRRPVPRLAEGVAAARAGATAMIDLSDGLLLDLDRLATASGVGVVIERIAPADGATRVDALSGGDDYELLFSARDAPAVYEAFAAAKLRPPIEIGAVVSDQSVRMLEGARFSPSGFEHRLRG